MDKKATSSSSSSRSRSGRDDRPHHHHKSSRKEEDAKDGDVRDVPVKKAKKSSRDKTEKPSSHKSDPTTTKRRKSSHKDEERKTPTEEGTLDDSGRPSSATTLEEDVAAAVAEARSKCSGGNSEDRLEEGAKDTEDGELTLSKDEELRQKRIKIRESGQVQLVDKRFLTHLSEMHPTSALHELCTKLNWPPPNMTMAFECGPPMGRLYIFKAVVNCQTYQPAVAVDNKKDAKANAAFFSLQEMGFIKKDPANPL